jgi:hypothetical protein
MAQQATPRQNSERAGSSGHPKLVRSDLKEVSSPRPVAIFPHDLEQTSPTRKDRHPLPMGARSDHVPHAVPRGDNERRGGRDRSERRWRRAVV